MSESMIDSAALEDFMQDDPQLLSDLSVIFVRNLPRALGNLNLAVELRDTELMSESAHQLKGQLTYFFCASLVDCALELEELARKCEMSEAAEKLAQLTHGIDRLIDELNRLTKLQLQIVRD